MLPAVWAPSPDYKEAKDVIANYVEALTEVVPPQVVSAFVRWARIEQAGWG